ncbi:hypothetical protein SISNIDRAFT_553320 [Sistotremastrum niveocremeum HHB9708]|uniref:Uncharacterized protein n=2 Tax=Sistotremastraceae TaxID=3402574 RepID=A0A164MWW3_9AGAM|nr:hypothetical protein SISNIDRAFT_553320 [Sistotremastrum niveocremeum HHB9708]KZT32800.1 hypothetical protein SISSUDRAFT_1132937 [Sistotremastrum suecicum HHB10207 ss-3]
MAIKRKKKNAQPEQVRPRVIISLPNELILEILRWYAAILRSDFIRSQNWNGFPPRLCYKVLRVSHAWRDLASSVPQLWENINLSWARTTIDDFLSRCRQTPRSINCVPEDEDAFSREACGTMLAQHLPTLVHLCLLIPISYPPSAREFGETYVNGLAPLLESVELVFVSRFPPHLDLHFPHLFMNDTPRLESIMLDRIWPWSLNFRPRPNLTNLRTLNVRLWGQLVMESFIALLSPSSPSRLGEISITSNGVAYPPTPNPSDTQILTLPYLRRLSLSGWHGADFERFLGKLIFPSLETVALGFRNRIDPDENLYLDQLPPQIQYLHDSCHSIDFRISKTITLKAFEEECLDDHDDTDNPLTPIVSYTSNAALNRDTIKNFTQSFPLTSIKSLSISCSWKGEIADPSVADLLGACSSLIFLRVSGPAVEVWWRVRTSMSTPCPLETLVLQPSSEWEYKFGAEISSEVQGGRPPFSHLRGLYFNRTCIASAPGYERRESLSSDDGETSFPVRM